MVAAPHDPGAPEQETVLAVRYLTGYVAANDGRGGCEWPPHPFRLFAALVAALHAGEDEPAERAALEWLERQPAPAVHASEADQRTVEDSYVPPNDFTVPTNPDRVKPANFAKALNILPERRNSRQPRTFPRARPHDDTVEFRWAEPCPQPAALAAVCERVTRLGHSASLVQVVASVAETPRDHSTRSRWHPDESAHHGIRLRVPGAGELAVLEAAFDAERVERSASLDLAVRDASSKQKKQAKEAFEAETGRAWTTNLALPNHRSPSSRFIRTYAREQPDLRVAGSVFDPQPLIFALAKEGEPGPPRLSAAQAIDACEALRQAVIQKADAGRASDNGPVPEEVSGHDPEGGPSQRPHLAYAPLTFVGHPHADGRVMGLAAILPLEREINARLHTLRALHAVESLRLGKLGRWKLLPVGLDEQRHSLQPNSWAGPPEGARRWATTTPAVFDRHPRGRTREARTRSAAKMVRRACVRIGLPEPLEVQVMDEPAVAGAPHARRWRRLPGKKVQPRPHANLVLRFAEPVRGPVLLGAGRFRGWGICVPIADRPQEGTPS